MSDCGDERGRATPRDHDGNAGARRRRALLAACAAFVASLALGVPGSGCLNPRPEELPSSGAEPDQLVPAADPPRDACDENPLLGDCALPDQDINANPVSPPASEAGGSEGPDSDPQPEPSDVPAPGAGGEGGGDAGSDVPADAGAP